MSTVPNVLLEVRALPQRPLMKIALVSPEAVDSPTRENARMAQQAGDTGETARPGQSIPRLVPSKSLDEHGERTVRHLRSIAYDIAL